MEFLKWSCNEHTATTETIGVVSRALYLILPARVLSVNLSFVSRVRLFGARGSADFCRDFCLPWRPELASCDVCRTRQKASNPRGHKFLFHQHHTSTQQPPKNQAKLLKQWTDLSLIRYVSARQILNIHLHSQSAQETVLEFISTHGYMPSLDTPRSFFEVSLTWGFCCGLFLLCCRFPSLCAPALLDLSTAA